MASRWIAARQRLQFLQVGSLRVDASPQLDLGNAGKQAKAKALGASLLGRRDQGVDVQQGLIPAFQDQQQLCR